MKLEHFHKIIYSLKATFYTLSIVVFATILTKLIVNQVYSETPEYRVEQKPRIATNGNPVFATYIWKDDKILNYWYDPISITEDMRYQRKKEAENIVETLKKAEK